MATCRHLCRTTRFLRPCFSPPTFGNRFLYLNSSAQAVTALPFQKVPTESSPDLSLSLKIWKSLPLTRLSGAGRTGVGHRRWVRKDTPALSPQTEQSQPRLSAPCSLRLSKLPSSSATRPAFPPEPAEAALAARQNQGGAGGIISPACLFCLFCLFCLYRMNCWRSTSFLTSARCSQT